MSKKTFSIILIISTVLTLSFSAFLFTPYFREINAHTNALIKEVNGINVGFGRSAQMDQYVKGDIFIAICQIAGMLAGVTSLIYTIWYIFHKSDSSFMMFLYCLSTPCLALAFTSIAISWPVYQAYNSNNHFKAYYMWPYYVTLICTALALFISAFALVYAVKNRKMK